MPKLQEKNKIIAIVGPTASGKSDLAVFLAKRFNGEIISADSRQIYRGLDIGSGKITKREMKGVTHHIISVASPLRQYSVARFLKDANKAIKKISKKNKIPIICGGTGLYIDALLGRVSIPEVPPDLKLRRRLAKKSAGELFLMLKNLNPLRAETIEKNNPRRLIRAIEIAKTAKKEIKPTEPLRKEKALWIGLRLPTEDLKEKIHKRLCARMRQGMASEVAKLHKNGISWKRIDEFGLEYRYVSRYLRGLLSKEEMLKKLNTEIWRYAKRQIRWFKRNNEIKWFTPAKRQDICCFIKQNC